MRRPQYDSHAENLRDDCRTDALLTYAALAAAWPRKRVVVFRAVNCFRLMSKLVHAAFGVDDYERIRWALLAVARYEAFASCPAGDDVVAELLDFAYQTVATAVSGQ